MLHRLLLFMLVFTRLWNLIRRPTGYVGRDLQGNYFYEHASTSGDPRRTRRVVKYRGQMDTLAVVERSRQLAVQWKSWLTHTRLHPPTLEELRADVMRQERLRQNVALIEAREREEREERLRLTAGVNATEASHLRHGELESASASQQDPSATNAQTEMDRGPAVFSPRSILSPKGGQWHAGDAREDDSANSRPVSQPRTKEQQKQQLHQGLKHYDHNPWAQQPSSDEPQAWTPRAIQRGA